MKNTKKILAIVLAIVMLFALSMTAFADVVIEDRYTGLKLGGVADPSATNSATYEVIVPEIEDYEDTATVTFIMETPDEYWEEEGAFCDIFKVTLGAADGHNDKYTVYDLLQAVESSHSEYSFNITYDAVLGTYYLVGVEHDGTLFQPDPVDYDFWGWTYRVNDKFPVEEFLFTYQNGATEYAYQGTYINTTYIKDGDVIHFFVDDPESLYGYSYAAEFIRINGVSASVGSVSASVSYHKEEFRTYFFLYDPNDPNSATGQDLQVCLSAYAPKAGQTVKLYTVDAYGAPDTLIASGVTLSDGSVTISDSDIVAGTYVLITDSVILNDPDEPADFSGFRFTQTTGYQIITVA